MDCSNMDSFYIIFLNMEAPWYYYFLLAISFIMVTICIAELLAIADSMIKKWAAEKERRGWRRAMTDEERRNYHLALRDTDGFEMPRMEAHTFGMIEPMTKKEMKKVMKTLMAYSELAIDAYNKKHGSKYVAVEVVKTMLSADGGNTYYITFQARDAIGVVKIFEAVIQEPIKSEGSPQFPPQLLLSREQGDMTVQPPWGKLQPEEV